MNMGAESVEDAPGCPHDGEVKNWKCMICGGHMPKFNIIFDEDGGSVQNFTKVLYENHFLSDFKADFKQ